MLKRHALRCVIREVLAFFFLQECAPKKLEKLYIIFDNHYTTSEEEADEIEADLCAAR
jgi:hypothetical protein